MNHRPGSASPGEMGRKWKITEVPDVEIEIKAWRLMKKDGLIFATGNLQKTLEGGDFQISSMSIDNFGNGSDELIHPTLLKPLSYCCPTNNLRCLCSVLLIVLTILPSLADTRYPFSTRDLIRSRICFIATPDHFSFPGRFNPNRLDNPLTTSEV